MTNKMILFKRNKPSHQMRNPAFGGFCLRQNSRTRAEHGVGLIQYRNYVSCTGLSTLWCGGKPSQLNSSSSGWHEAKPITTKIWREGKEKGAALLITFSIMGIALSIVLGISTILISEIKMIRGMGNSVKAFYTADTGMEEILYFDRIKIPEIEGATRGFCNICNVCPEFGCEPSSCVTSGYDCDPVSCRNCQISYYTDIGDDRRYNIISSITPTEESFKSYGTYANTTRAIELNFIPEIDDEENPQAPRIYNASVVPRSVLEGVELEIVADIFDPDGVGNVEVHIQYPDENDIDVVDFPLYSGVTYKATWTGPEGFYFVDIIADDLEGNSSECENI